MVPQFACFLLLVYLPGPLGTRQRYIHMKTIHHLEFIIVFAITLQLSCVWVPYIYVQNILSPFALTYVFFYVSSHLMFDMWNFLHIMGSLQMH